MKKNIAYILLPLLILSSFTLKAQSVKKPKLVIGIVIDQMRYDYLTRFADKYGDGGFNRIINGGFSL